MQTAYTPKRLRVLKAVVISLLATLLLLYLVFAIIRAATSPVLLDTQLIPMQLHLPTVILEGKRAQFEQANIFVQGMFLDATGHEMATPNIDGALTQLTYGKEIETNLPDEFNDQMNQDHITWWLRPGDAWRFAVNFTEAAGDTSRLFTAVRIGVKIPSTANDPALNLRLLQPGSSQAYFAQSQLNPVGTSVVGRNREVRCVHTVVRRLKGATNTLYSAINLDYTMPNTTTPADFFLTLRPGNTLDDSGMFLQITQTERLAFTWYDVLTGAGGLLGLLTTAYFFLFGASKLRTWGPVQWLMREKIIAGTEQMYAKDLQEKADLSIDERLSQLESFKDRINHYYIEHSLFEDKYAKWV